MFSYNRTQRETNSFSIYKDGVNLCYLRGKQPIAFRILPAFPPHILKNGKMIDPDSSELIPADAWVPFVDENQAFFDWVCEIRVAGRVGHNDWKQRPDIVSRLSLNLSGDDGKRIRVEDPYWELQQYVRNHASATWGYLQKSVGAWGSKDRQSPVLPFLGRRYLMNIVRTDDLTKVQLGELSVTSAADMLLGDGGLALAPNKHASDEMIEKDYINQYDNGDITDPCTGKVFVLEKDLDSGKGDASPYKIGFASSYDREKRRTVYATMDVSKLLPGRYDLGNVESILKIPTCEEQVKQLVGLLNGRTPDGQFHEYSLMKEAWIECGHPDWAAMVPEPPASVYAPATSCAAGADRNETRPVSSPGRYQTSRKATARISTQESYDDAGVTGNETGEEEPVDPPKSDESLDTLPFPDESGMNVVSSAKSGNDPIQGVAGEAVKPAGDWRARYKAKFGQNKG